MVIHDEEVKKALMKCGWSEDRNFDISAYEEWYRKYGYDMPEAVREVLTAFGGLILKIPCFRYANYYRVTGKTPESEDDLYQIIHIDPRFFIKDSDTEFNILCSKTYTKDMAAHFKMEEVYPIGEIPSRDCCFEEIFMGRNGELILSDEDSCICLGDSFEAGIGKIMTSADTDLEYFECSM